MSVSQELVNFDWKFANLSRAPLLANDIDISRTDEKERLNDLIMMRYNGDTLDIVPECDCGELRGGYNVGITCKVCDTTVTSVTERPLESIIWIKSPDGVRSLVNPVCWIMMKDFFTINGNYSVSLLDYICTNSYKVPNNYPINNVIPEEWPRSLNFFHDNFDGIMDHLLKTKEIRDKYKERVEDMRTFIQQNRKKIFCQYLPFPSKIGFVTENTVVGAFHDPTMTTAIDAIRTISSLKTSVTPLKLNSIENRTVKAISQLSQYYYVFMKDTLGGKIGVYRKHIFGGRSHFTARAVISSLTENHDYDELHLPWGVAVQAYRVHLTNKLLKRVNPDTGRRYTAREITAIFFEYVNRYSPVLNELFLELIAESPWKGLPCILQRNPSLARGSAQMFYVTKIKTDVANKTISLSVLCIKSSNADFDGDELNLLLIHDRYTHDRLSRLAPHLNVLDLRKPRTISSNLAIPPSVISTLDNFLMEPGYE